VTDFQLGARDSFRLVHWLILGALTTVQFLNILDFIVIMPLGPLFLDGMKLTTEQFGAVVASYGYASSAAGVLAAGWIHRTPRRTTALLLVALFACSSYLCYVAPDFWTLVLARCFTGACGGLISAIVLSIVSDVFPESRRGFAMGILMTSFSMASVVGVPFGLWLADWSSSAQRPFYYLALACIPAWLVLFFVLPHIARPHSDHAGGYWRTMTRILVEPAHAWALLFTAVLVFQTFLIVPYLATYFVKNVGLPKEQLAWIYVFGGGATFFSMPIIGRIADRFGKPRTYVWIACLAIFPTIAIPLLPPMASWGCTMITTFYFILTSARMVPGQAMVSSVPAPELRAGFLSLSGSVQAFSTGMAASVSALIVQQSTDGQLERLWFAGVLGAIFFALSLLLVPKLKPSSSRSPEATDQ
jgi:predicted MFS family arabinose efflux permease